jgi:hypothetical protein
MDELQQAMHKFERENAHLLRIMEEIEPLVAEGERIIAEVDRISLALASAKRVRTASTVLVRALARHRDQLQPQGGHKPA